MRKEVWKNLTQIIYIEGQRKASNKLPNDHVYIDGRTERRDKHAKNYECKEVVESDDHPCSKGTWLIEEPSQTINFSVILINYNTQINSYQSS